MYHCLDCKQDREIDEIAVDPTRYGRAIRPDGVVNVQIDANLRCKRCWGTNLQMRIVMADINVSAKDADEEQE